MKKTVYSIVILIVLACNCAAQVYTDATLVRVREQDRASRDTSGKLPTISAAEHGYRAEVYSTNRAFPEAREHWQKILDNYPNDAGMPKTLLGIGRSYMWERKYEQAILFFERAVANFAATKAIT